MAKDYNFRKGLRYDVEKRQFGVSMCHTQVCASWNVPRKMEGLVAKLKWKEDDSIIVAADKDGRWPKYALKLKKRAGSERMYIMFYVRVRYEGVIKASMLQEMADMAMIEVLE